MASLAPLLLLLLVLPAALATTPSPYNPQDISEISLYGPTAVYGGSGCPPAFTFTGRARFLEGLKNHQIGIRSSDVSVGGRKCNADAPHLVFVPIGNTDHYPPQWHFEHSKFSDRPINFTCGSHKFAIRYGYFNDVDTKLNNGFLDANVLYFDFAVIPNSIPFAFCSYSARREDHDRPLDHAPFPTKATWEKLHERRASRLDRNIPAVPLSDNPDEETPMPVPSAEEDATPSPQKSPEDNDEPEMSPDLDES